MTATIYLARHATPDWSRTDIRYDIPPGPPLTAQGESEAEALGSFLRQQGITAIYVSPLERTLRTADIAGEIAGAPVTIEESIAEWRRGEEEGEVVARFATFWEAIRRQAVNEGPIALVTHGGPVAVMLAKLGMSDADLGRYRRQFDRHNPLPPAGVWAATDGGDRWQLELVFTPETQPSTYHL